jgi:phosphoglycolate phosphatase
MSQPRLAVFDCDGTLVDSQNNIVAAMAAAWRGHGLEPLPASSVRRIVGLSLVEAIAVLLPEGESGDHVELGDRYKEAYRTLREQADHHEPLYPGAAESLQMLDEAGILLAVATGKTRRGLKATLEWHGLTDRFVALKTADDGPGKPHPHMLEEAMAEAGASPASTVMIGDTVFDIEMARNAKVHSIGVSWGYHDPDELRAAGAHDVIDEFGELAALAATLYGGENATR